MASIPHPIPYQGSKRKIAPVILKCFPSEISTLIEPFAGSSAVTLASANENLADHYHINDLLKPLAEIWRLIVHSPEELAEQYRDIWEAQLGNRKTHYNRVRDEFNEDGDPAKLLYLLARCVKNAVRFNSAGEFNQSADHRRKGRKPTTMRRQLLDANFLLQNQTRVTGCDYAEILSEASPSDLVYMDPPYMGTSTGSDPRYYDNLDYERFVSSLEKLLSRDVPFVVSFDGRCGGKEYGPGLPDHLGLFRLEVDAGTSSQATLNGKKATTVESLYLSPGLASEFQQRDEFEQNPDRQGRLL